MRSVSRFSCCIAAVALLLALPSSASAASRTKRRTTRTAPTTSTPAPSPTPEATTTVDTSAGSTAEAAPVAASTQKSTAPQLARANSGSSTFTARSSLEQSAPPPPRYAVSVGVGPAIPLGGVVGLAPPNPLGGSFGGVAPPTPPGGDIGWEFVARGVVSIPVKTSGKASIWFVLPLRVNTASYSISDPLFGVSTSSSMLRLALVPTIQGSGELAPRLRGYAGVGAGLAHSRLTTDAQFTGPRTMAVTVGELDLISGVEYALDDRFSFILEPVGGRLFTYPLSLVWTPLLGVSAKI
jgi:hypothetical protein